MISNVNSMLTHSAWMDINANNVANINTKDFKASDAKIGNNLQIETREVDNNLTKELTDQIIIEDGFKAQAVPIKTQDEMTKTLLDIKA